MSKVENFDLRGEVRKSVFETFDTMLSLEVQEAKEPLPLPSPGTRIVGTVSFAGEVMGCVNIHLSYEFAHLITAAMLGMEPEEVEGEEEIKDVISELTNIIGGNLKSAYCDLGLQCKLSTPSITSGEDFKIESFNIEKYERFSFISQSHALTVEVGVRLELKGPQEGEEDQGTEPLNLNEILEAADSNEVTTMVSSAVSSTAEAEATPQQSDTQEVEQEDSLDKGSAQAETEKMEVEREANTEQQEEKTFASPPIESKTSTDLKKKGLAKDKKEGEGRNTQLILDIPLEMRFHLGYAKIKIEELLKLSEGAVIEFSRAKDDPVDVFVNQKLVARGEVVIIGEHYGIRILETVSPEERIKCLE